MNNFLDKTSRATVSLARMALSLAIIAWAAIGIQDSMSHLFGRKKKVVVYVEKTTKATPEKEVKEESAEESKKVDEPKVETGDQEMENPFEVKDPLKKPESHLPKTNKSTSGTKKTTK